MSTLNFLQRTSLALDNALASLPVHAQVIITTAKHVGIRIVSYEDDSTWDKKVGDELIQRVDVKCLMVP